MSVNDTMPAGAEQVRPAGEELKPAWRAACLAYRKVRRTGALDQPAWMAARQAVKECLPALTEEEAGAEASRAILYASTWHRDWFWSGVGGEWRWPREA